MPIANPKTSKTVEDVVREIERRVKDIGTIFERVEPLPEDLIGNPAENIRHSVLKILREYLPQEKVHKHTRGGNDYISCDDCGQEWDYSKQNTEPKECKPTKST
jgi:hypothetical protein